MNARHGAVTHRPPPEWTAVSDGPCSQITLGRLVWLCHKARVWQTDGQTNGQTDRLTDRITTPKTALA